MRVLKTGDVVFINAVARRRFSGGDAELDAAALENVLAETRDAEPFHRAAAVAGAVAAGLAGGGALLQTALLVLHCSLALDGYSLLAPQGVVAGMVRGLAETRDATAVARWLEDRAVLLPAS